MDTISRAAKLFRLRGGNKDVGEGNGNGKSEAEEERILGSIDTFWPGATFCEWNLSV